MLLAVIPASSLLEVCFFTAPMLRPTPEHCSFTEPHCGMCALSSSPKHSQCFPKVALWQCAAGAAWWNVAAILRSSAVTTRALRSRDALHAYAALETGNAAIITEFLNSQFWDTVSFYDAHESFCHGFLLSTCTNWRVSINAETRKGRSDIIVERKDRKIGFVVEVKDVKDGGKLEHAREAAMKQIEEKGYTAILRRYRAKEIRTYGIAFWDKECRVAAKSIVR